jgi:hypothetical protein
MTDARGNLSKETAVVQMLGNFFPLDRNQSNATRVEFAPRPPRLIRYPLRILDRVPQSPEKIRPRLERVEVILAVAVVEEDVMRIKIRMTMIRFRRLVIGVKKPNLGQFAEWFRLLARPVIEHVKMSIRDHNPLKIPRVRATDSVIIMHVIEDVRAQKPLQCNAPNTPATVLHERNVHFFGLKKSKQVIGMTSREAWHSSGVWCLQECGVGRLYCLTPSDGHIGNSDGQCSDRKSMETIR